MIKVEQTIRGELGNCFGACVASIFELPVGDMPDYLQGIPDNPNWLNVWREWLAKRNLGIVYTRFCCADCVPPAGYSILTIGWKDSSIAHAVVCFNGEIVHDPVSGKLGADFTKYFWHVFTVLDPVK